MAVGDRYDPRDWDRYCEKMEALYQELIHGKTCFDCWNCEEHENGTFLCTETGEEIKEGDTPRSIDCEWYK